MVDHDPESLSGSSEAAHGRGGGGVSRRAFLCGAAAAAGSAAVVGTQLATGVASADTAGSAGGAASAGGRVRRWAMVIDLSKCDGCTGLGIPPQCTQNCVWGRVVPDGMQWIQVFETKTGSQDGSGTSGGGAAGYLSASCMHCQNAPCANVCPVGATFQSPEGTVLIDQERCIGCRLCMAACPYDRRFFNWSQPVQPQWLEDMPYSIEDQAPAIRGTVMKCDFCTDRLAGGGLPMCAKGCPQAAIYFGDLEEDVATNGFEVVQLSKFLQEKNAFRYKEELGTDPRVWYIPGDGHGVAPEVAHPVPETAELEWIGPALASWEKTHPVAAMPQEAQSE